MKFEYYFNDVPGKGLCRNNLIYTSLMSTDKKVFVQHYVNDTEYHRGRNRVVDPDKMSEKWSRELMFLHHMRSHAPECIPEILDIDLVNKKIFLKVDGVDFWQKQLNGEEVPADWQDQMLAIIKKHRELGLWKFSMHPSSYFVVDGKLKSINYFFTYTDNDSPISIKDVESHISDDRQAELRKHLSSLNIDWNKPQSFETMNKLCWASFSTNYPADFIKKVLSI